MAINLNDNIRINAPKPSDERYINSNLTSYSNVSEVNASISPSRRHIGLTVLIGNVEYWYLNGIDDLDLVPKGISTMPNLQNVSDAGGFDNGSTLRKGSKDNYGFGGGISQVCVAEKELQWENGVEYYFSVGGNIVHANSINGNIPDNTYDSTKSWAVGSRFTDLVTGNIYVCTDDTIGNAVWMSANRPIYLTETSTIANFETGKTYYYIGDAPITYDYDLLPYPSPIPVSGFNFVNLSTFNVVFSSGGGNITYTITPNQRLENIQVVDNGTWELFPITYFDNIYDLQQVTSKGATTTDAIIVRNNPDSYRTRYSTIGQQIQYGLGDRSVDYTYDRIQINKPSNLASWTINFPNIDSNIPLSNTVVDFRPNVSGTVAYLSDITASTLEFYTDTSFFPVTGTEDIIYVSKTTNELYVWSNINVAYELLSVGTLQQVTAIGNSTINDIQLNGSQLRLSNFFTNAILRANPANENLDIGSNSNAFYASLNKQLLTENRTFSFPDKTGTFALLDDIAGGSTNIYNTNGNLSDNRILDGDGFSLDFSNIDQFNITSFGQNVYFSSESGYFNVADQENSTGIYATKYATGGAEVAMYANSNLGRTAELYLYAYDSESSPTVTLRYVNLEPVLPISSTLMFDDNGVNLSTVGNNYGYTLTLNPTTQLAAFTDNTNAKRGLLLLGFGESDVFDTSLTADYLDLANTSVVTKGYVDQISLNNIRNQGNNVGANIVIGTNDNFNLGFETNNILRFNLDTNGLLSSTTLNYETLVLTNNSITNKKYVDDKIWNNSSLALMPANTVKVNATISNTTPQDLAISNNQTLGRLDGNIQPIPLTNALITNGTDISALENTTNWTSNGVFMGTLTVAEQGQRYINDRYYYLMVNNTTPIRIPRGLDNMFIQSSVQTNTAQVETNLPIVGRGTNYIMADTLNLGNSFKIHVEGLVDSSVNNTLTFRIKIGTVSIPVNLPVLNGNNQYFSASFMLTILNTGVTGTFIGQGVAMIESGSYPIKMTNNGIIDTEIDNELNISSEFSAIGTYSFKVTNFIITRHVI